MSVARRCDTCKEVVDRPQLVHSLTTRTKDQQRYTDFCRDECAIEWLEARIENRRRKAAMDEQAARVAEAADAPPPNVVVALPPAGLASKVLAPRGYGQ